MAWIDPRTWTDGLRITAARLNEISSSLRETAPAKAQALGDLFYTTGQNAIARLAIGSVGRFLVPTSSGPRWQAVPTPITDRGDLVIGGSSGAPERVGVGSGVRVLKAEGGAVEWTEEIFLEEWWNHSQWWTESASQDVTWNDGDEIDQGFVIGRDLTIDGTVMIVSSPSILRFRDISLSADATIRSVAVLRNEELYDYSESLSPNAGGVSGTGRNPAATDGLRGSLVSGSGGGGGGGWRSNFSSSEGSPGSDPSQTIGLAEILSIIRGEIGFSTGGGLAGTGGGGASSSSAPIPALGGGVLLIAAKSISLNGYSLSIDCGGADGEDGIGSNSFLSRGGGGGGGGGCLILIVQDGTSGVIANVGGGSGGDPHPFDGSNSGGDGGDGISYIGTSFPS